jgi:hypothetical protein
VAKKHRSAVNDAESAAPRLNWPDRANFGLTTASPDLNLYTGVTAYF